jgi:hypothetical protein
VRLQHPVRSAGFLQQAGLFGVQEMLDKQVSVAVKIRVLSVRQGEGRRHGKGSQRFQISDFRFQISDFRFQISDFRFEI